MKKAIAIALSLLIILSLCACGGGEKTPDGLQAGYAKLMLFSSTATFSQNRFQMVVPGQTICGLPDFAKRITSSSGGSNL